MLLCNSSNKQFFPQGQAFERFTIDVNFFKSYNFDIPNWERLPNWLVVHTCAQGTVTPLHLFKKCVNLVPLVSTLEFQIISIHNTQQTKETIKRRKMWNVSKKRGTIAGVFFYVKMESFWQYALYIPRENFVTQFTFFSLEPGSLLTHLRCEYSTFEPWNYLHWRKNRQFIQR